MQRTTPRFKITIEHGMQEVEDLNVLVSKTIVMCSHVTDLPNGNEHASHLAVTRHTMMEPSDEYVGQDLLSLVSGVYDKTTLTYTEDETASIDMTSMGIVLKMLDRAMNGEEMPQGWVLYRRGVLPTVEEIARVVAAEQRND